MDWLLQAIDELKDRNFPHFSCSPSLTWMIQKIANPLTFIQILEFLLQDDQPPE
ncbi:hypothetical protein QOT17_025398, partial [Balamuthia mandrillaris]